MTPDGMPPGMVAFFWTLGLSSLLLAVCLLAWAFLTY